MTESQTSAADGTCDASPKGDPAGQLVHVLDDTTIALAERPGNRRADGFANIQHAKRVKAFGKRFSKRFGHVLNDDDPGWTIRGNGGNDLEQGLWASR